MNVDLEHALDVAREAAAAAAEVLRHYWQCGVEVELKSDATPVTAADREAEAVIREHIGRAFPRHAIFGEEQGRGTGEDADCLWLVDPLDGTKSFVRGTPFFSTQIALMVAGELVLGVSSAPLFDEVLWARKGAGAYCNGERIHVAATQDIAQASLSTGNIHSLTLDARWDALGKLIRICNRSRGYGDFCHYHLLARGGLDVVVESDLNILDVAALAVIVREAGGVFTDLHGAPLSLETRSALAAVPALHGEFLTALSV